jgi:hypothetical protein
MAKFIKIDDKIINVDHIAFIVESENIYDEKYTKFFLTHGFVNTKLKLDEVYKLIEDCSS